MERIRNVSGKIVGHDDVEGSSFLLNGVIGDFSYHNWCRFCGNFIFDQVLGHDCVFHFGNDPRIPDIHAWGESLRWSPYDCPRFAVSAFYFGECGCKTLENCRVFARLDDDKRDEQIRKFRYEREKAKR